MERPDTSNYFRFYGLPERFEMDTAALKSLYLEKSKLYHPDFYGHDPESQTLAVASSAYNNMAYKILSNDVQRAMYLTSLKFEDSDNPPALPQAFLMDMMDINEDIDEADDAGRTDLLNRIDGIRTQTLQEIKSQAVQENWPLLQIAILKWKYLERLLGRLV